MGVPDAVAGSRKPSDTLRSLVSPNLLARNVAWLSAGEFLSRLIAFGVGIILARELGAGRYGALGIALALVNYLVVLVDGGLDPVAVREVARKPHELPRLVRRIVGQRLLVAGVTYAVLIPLVFLLPDRLVGARVLALIFGGRLFTYALKCDWALRGREDMKAVALGLIVQHVLYGLGILALVRYSDIPLLLVPIIHVAAEVVLALFYAFRLRASSRPLWGSGTQGRRDGILRESMPVGLGKVFRLAYYEGDLLLLGWLAAPEQAGYFLASQKIVLSLAALVVLYQQTAFPALSRFMLVDVPGGVRFQETVSRYALFWSVPVAAGGVYLSGPVMELLFGPEYRASVPVLAIMLFSLPIVLVQLGLHNQMLALGETRPYLYTVAAGTAVHVALGIMWVPAWGGVGAAWANLLGECVTCGLAVGYSTVRHRTPPLTGRSAAILLAGAAMVLVMSFLPPLNVLVSGLVGLAVYLLVALTLGGLKRREAHAVLALFRRAS